MSCWLQSIAGVLPGFLPIYPAGRVGWMIHKGDCTAQFVPKYVLWGCSLAILQTAPSWWRCPDEGKQGLSEQMALMCLVKCPCRAHQVNNVSLTWESPYLVRPSFLLRRPPELRRWQAAYGPLSGFSTLCPLQAERVVVGSQQGLPCESIGMLTMGQEPLFYGLFYQPSFHANSSSTPSRTEHLWSDPQQNKVLTRCGLLSSPHGLAWHQSSNNRTVSHALVG